MENVPFVFAFDLCIKPVLASVTVRAKQEWVLVRWSTVGLIEVTHQKV
jgi:hypothetical protein